MSAEAKKFRSPFRDINLKMLRLLCDLHPWSMAELCKAVDLEPNVLSMVWAGKRPLPTRVARQFLDLVGMREDGSLDPQHGFIFKEKSGREAELIEIFSRLFPTEAVAVHLTRSESDPANPTKPPVVKTGRAFYDGKSYVAVLHGSNTNSPIAWGLNQPFTLKDYESPEDILATIKLPTKNDILRAFSRSKFPPMVTWKEVVQQGKQRKVEPEKVLEWITLNFPDPKPEKLDQPDSFRST